MARANNWREVRKSPKLCPCCNKISPMCAACPGLSHPQAALTSTIECTHCTAFHHKLLCCQLTLQTILLEGDPLMGEAAGHFQWLGCSTCTKLGRDGPPAPVVPPFFKEIIYSHAQDESATFECVHRSVTRSVTEPKGVCKMQDSSNPTQVVGYSSGHMQRWLANSSADLFRPRGLDRVTRYTQIHKDTAVFFTGMSGSAGVCICPTVRHELNAKKENLRLWI